MSLSGDKGVAQFKKSVKMGHPIAGSRLIVELQFDIADRGIAVLVLRYYSLILSYCIPCLCLGITSSDG